MRIFYRCQAAVFFSAAVLFTVVSCTKKQPVPVTEIPVQADSFSWYAFSGGSFQKIGCLSDAPSVPAKPWTEAVRISSMATSFSDGGGGVPKGYAVVNRLGILVFDGDDAGLFSDTTIFSGKSARNLVLYENTPLFMVYRSSFFNEADSSPRKNGSPFLIQFDPEQRLSYPVLSVENLGLDEGYEITDFIWDGSVWTCSAKASEDARTVFSYVSFQPKIPLLSVTPENAPSSVFIEKSSAEKFRDAQKSSEFSKAPERLKDLLQSLPDTVDFSVTCYNAGGHSPRTFVSVASETISSGTQLSGVLSAVAVLSDTWGCVLFEDGTVFIKGALYGRPVLNGGKAVAMKLPKIPAGFVYSGFSLSGSSLYASWEETSFFKTARSGFIRVDLDVVLFGRE